MQEIRWRGSSCRYFGDTGKKYKLFWMGSEAKSEGVGIFVAEKCVDIGASAKLELVDKFCYLGDMLNAVTCCSVDGDADAVVEARIRIGWNKFRQLVPLLTNKDVYLSMRGRLYSNCVQSSMLHGSETWPVRKENVATLQ